MKVVYILITGLWLMWGGIQEAKEVAVNELEQLLQKPYITKSDKERAAVLFSELTAQKNNPSALLTAERLGYRWKIKLLESGCDKFGKIVPIIGKENFERAVRGQSIDPTKFNAGSRQLITDLEQKAADLQKIMDTLKMESADSAKNMIIALKAQVLPAQNQQDLAETIRMLSEEITDLKNQLVTENSRLEVIEENLNQLKDKQKAPTKTCDEMNEVRTKAYIAALGQKNFDALKNAVDQKSKNQAANIDVGQLLTWENFPSDSLFLQETQKLQERVAKELQEAKENLTKVQQELEIIKKADEASAREEFTAPVQPAPTPPAPSAPASGPNVQQQPESPTLAQGQEPVVTPPIPTPPVSTEPSPTPAVLVPLPIAEPQPTPIPTPNSPASPAPEPVTPQKQNQPEPEPAPLPVVQGTVELPTQPEPAPQPTPSATADCEKKLIKIRMALNDWSSRWSTGWWYHSYLKPIVENEELSQNNRIMIGLSDDKNAALAKLPDCEKKMEKIKLVQKRYENDKKTAEKDQAVSDDLMDRYIEPILQGTEWSKNAVASSFWGSKSSKSDYDQIRDYNKQALSDANKNTFGITKEEYEAIFGK